MAKFLIGSDESKAKGQFEINPKLQRTQASGNEKGIELGTNVLGYPPIQNKIITLKNRAVPLNLKNTPNKKRSVQFDKPSLTGVSRAKSRGF